MLASKDNSVIFWVHEMMQNTVSFFPRSDSGQNRPCFQYIKEHIQGFLELAGIGLRFDIFDVTAVVSVEIKIDKPWKYRNPLKVQ